MNTPEKCPQCGAGLAASEYAAAYRCGTLVSSSGRFYHTGNCRSFSELRKPLDVERDQLAERVKRLESVVTDPHALWSNWLRGDIQLPAGIGDIRECSEKMKRFRSRWLAAHQELRRTEDRVERAEERVKQLEDETARWAAAYRDLGTYKP